MFVRCKDQSGYGGLKTLYRFRLKSNIMGLKNVVKGRHNVRVDLCASGLCLGSFTTMRLLT